MPPSQTSSLDKVVVSKSEMSQQKGTTQSDEIGRSNRTDLRTIPENVPVSLPSQSDCGVQNANLHKESERLKTFERWTVDFMPPRRLTSAGFYFTQKGDDVRCAFCGIVVGRWVRGDDPMADHERWSPACPFVRNLPISNVPLEQDEDQINGTSPANGYDVCGPYGMEMHTLSSDPNSKSANLIEKYTGYQKSRAASFANYASYDARLKSFKTWPISLKVKPDVLSDAGFFYTGKGDQTLCFHCGGGLKDWEENDEPWVEHARWFSKCPFVIIVKGKEFIDEVNGAKALKDIESTGLSVTCNNVDSEKLPSTSAQNCEQKIVSDVQSTPPAASDNEKQSSGDRLCKICYSEEVGLVFLPCAHIVACVKCGVSLTTCAICRKPVEGTFRAFFS